MAGENEGTETQPNADLAAEQAAFDAPEEPTTETPVNPDAEQKTEPEVETPKEPEYAQITKADLEELKAKANSIDKAFGHIGALKQAVEQIRQPGKPIEITPEDFPEMRAEFPELVDLQVKGLNKVLAKMSQHSVAEPKPEPKPAETKPTLDDEIRQVREQNQIDQTLDEIVNGDWVETVRSKDFTDWMSTQPAEVQALAKSDSVKDAASQLRMFKRWQLKKPAPQVSTRTQQLAAAVNPRGTPSAPRKAEPTTEEEGFNAAL